MVGKRDGQGRIGSIGQDKGKEGTTNHAQWHMLASCLLQSQLFAQTPNQKTVRARSDIECIERNGWSTDNYLLAFAVGCTSITWIIILMIDELGRVLSPLLAILTMIAMEPREQTLNPLSPRSLQSVMWRSYHFHLLPRRPSLPLPVQPT
jgi:hypothetical protein